MFGTTKLVKFLKTQRKILILTFRARVKICGYQYQMRHLQKQTDCFVPTNDGHVRHAIMFLRNLQDLQDLQIASYIAMT